MQKDYKKWSYSFFFSLQYIHLANKNIRLATMLSTIKDKQLNSMLKIKKRYVFMKYHVLHNTCSLTILTNIPTLLFL